MAFASIPTPQPDIDALQRTCMALKQAVEQIVGMRGGERMPSIFVQNTQPDETTDGDFWLVSGTTTTLSIAINGKWMPVGNLV